MRRYQRSGEVDRSEKVGIRGRCEGSQMRRGETEVEPMRRKGAKSVN